MKQHTKVKQLGLLAVLVLCMSVTAFAQVDKNNQNHPKIEQDDNLKELLKEGNQDKGVQAISYTITKDILQLSQLKVVNFNVKVEREQDVLIEVFSAEGDLIEVIYNDLMPSDQKFNFNLNGQKWSEDVHYLRVTTEDYIENHEIAF